MVQHLWRTQFQTSRPEHRGSPRRLPSHSITGLTLNVYLTAHDTAMRSFPCGNVVKLASDLIQASTWYELQITGDVLWTPHSHSNGGILKATCFCSASVGISAMSWGPELLS